MSASTSRKFTGLKNVLEKLHRIEDGIIALLLFAMILIASSQIVLRNLFESGIIWADPLLRVMVLWLGLLGALAATRENKHITIDLLTRFLTETARLFSKSFANLFSSIVAGLLAYHSARFVIMEYESQSTVITTIPAWIVELILPIAFSLMSLRFVIHFIISLRVIFTRKNKDDQ